MEADDRYKGKQDINGGSAHNPDKSGCLHAESQAEAARRRREKRTLYYIGLSLLGAVAVILIVYRITGLSVGAFLLPCLFHTLTGYYCPGCGGTRAVASLLNGNILESIYHHPFVVYAAVIFTAFMVTNTIELLSRGRCSIGMEFRHRYVYTGIVIVAVNFVIKNSGII